MNEILLYGQIYDFTATNFISAFNDIEGDNLTIRVNSSGGSVEYGWGMIAKFKEFEGKKLVKVDGQAYSMAFNFCLYADKVECLDVSRFMVHRASYGWIESTEYFTEALKANLDGINKSLKAAFESKIDVAKFEKITGVTLKELFSMEGQKDVFIDAKQAKAIGLVDKINTITIEKANSINANMAQVAASYSGFEPIVVQSATEPIKQVINNKTNKPMTVEQLKADHPEVHAAIFNSGFSKGVSDEKDRTGAWAAFMEVDPIAVKEGIKSGEPLTATATAEFQVKMFSSQTLANITTEGVQVPVVGANGEVKLPETQTEVDKLQALAMASAGVTPKDK